MHAMIHTIIRNVGKLVNGFLFNDVYSSKNIFREESQRQSFTTRLP